MANALYTKFKNTLGTSANTIDMASSNFKVALVDSAAYTPDLANDQFFSDIASTIAESANLTTLSWAGAVWDADNITFTGVSGAEFEYVVVYQDTGTPATSALICIFDSASGLPLTPNSGDITVTWGANIFTL